MTTNDVQALLESLFEQLSDQPDSNANDPAEEWKADIESGWKLAGCRVTTFEQGGYMTSDAGLVVRLPNGEEFQITIVQSRHAE